MAGKRPRLLALANQKGGVGKTTIAVNLSCALAARGKTVLLVDGDSQAAATSWLMGPGEADPSLADVLMGERSVEETAVELWENLSLLPASGRLAVVEKTVAADPGPKLTLKTALADVRCDFVLMDCPPSLGFLAVQSLAAASEVLAPLQTEPMALRGLANLQRLVGVIRARFSPGLDVSGIIPTMYDFRLRICREILWGLRERFGSKVLPPIRADVRLKEAPAHRQPIQRFAPSCRAAMDFEQLADCILSGGKEDLTRG